MSPHLRQNDIIVSDEESEAETEEAHPFTLQVGDCPSKKQPRAVTRTWQECFRRLVRVGARGNTRPAVGQVCLVVVGNAHDELGQVGVVIGRTPAMVEIMVQPTSGARCVSLLKRPSSLILLEAGLTLVQDPDGSVWIRRVQKV
jgi:hypothetical protein